MSKRPEPLTAREQADLGRVVLALRDNGVCWKAIEDEFGLTRRHLWRCALMSQNTPGMSHPGDCGLSRAA